jgi:hypothetical protein
MEWGTIIAAAITALCALAGTYISNRKSTALVEYRMKQLEIKVDKHNNVIERTYKLEGQMTAVQQEITDLKKG